MCCFTYFTNTRTGTQHKNRETVDGMFSQNFGFELLTGNDLTNSLCAALLTFKINGQVGNIKIVKTLMECFHKILVLNCFWQKLLSSELSGRWCTQFMEPIKLFLTTWALYKRAPDLVWFSSYSLFGPLCSVSFSKFCLQLFWRAFDSVIISVLRHPSQRIVRYLKKEHL